MVFHLIPQQIKFLLHIIYLFREPLSAQPCLTLLPPYQRGWWDCKLLLKAADLNGAETFSLSLSLAAPQATEKRPARPPLAMATNIYASPALTVAVERPVQRGHIKRRAKELMRRTCPSSLSCSWPLDRRGNGAHFTGWDVPLRTSDVFLSPSPTLIPSGEREIKDKLSGVSFPLHLSFTISTFTTSYCTARRMSIQAWQLCILCNWYV